jgi:predicted porin
LSATGETGSYEQIAYDATVNNSIIQRNDLNAYDIGAMATYFGFTLGGSWGSWGDSLMPKTGIYSCKYDGSVALGSQDCVNDVDYANSIKRYDDATYWTAGLAYQFGPVAFSATHLSSDFQDNDYAATSIGVDYRLAKGLMPYLEVTQFKFESDQVRASDVVDQATLNNEERQLKDNEGYVVLTGILFAF